MSLSLVLRFASRRTALLLAPVAVLLALVGCGPSKARINGKVVVAGGQAVTEGTITFSPVAPTKGEQAMGQVKSDGAFSLDGGAVVGKHAVGYRPPVPEGPEWDGYGAPPPNKVSPFANMVPKDKEVEVKSGKNDITIELVPAPPDPNAANQGVPG